MQEMFIKNYIKKMTINDLRTFALKENYFLLPEEEEIIFYYIKNYWQVVLKEDPTPVFNDLKLKVRPETFNKIIQLYNHYKNYL